MTMHPLLVNRLIYPVHERLKGKRTHAHLRDLEQSQWLPIEPMKDLQFQRLKRHLEFAYREVPYYRRTLDECGLPPERIGSLEDFARIPFLTKEIIRARFDELRPRTRMRGVQRMSTGGSTGAPVTVLVDRERAAFTDATRLRAHRWFGADMGAREIVLWGSPIELGRQDRLRRLRDWLLNSRLLSAFDLGEQALARYAGAVKAARPEKLFGYASALSLLAGYLGRSGWTATEGWPRVVFTTAEPLFDFQRAVIQAVFNCPAATEYGCRDGGLIANECPEGGLHIAAEGILVEADGGELIVTNLESYAMPIIRYRTGDVGALEDKPCPCGRGLPLLRGVEGRRTDFLVTPDGRVMHALAVIYILREIPAIREFQVVQDRLDRITVTVVPAGEFPGAAQQMMASRLTTLFGARMSVDISLAERIPRPSGKHRYVVSTVADEYLASVLEAR